MAVNDEDGYSNAVLQLAKDRGRMATMSEAAIAAVKFSHSTVAMASRWEAMLDGMLGSKTPEWSIPCRASAPLGYEKRLLFKPIFRPIRSAMKRFRYGNPPSNEPT